MTNDCDKNYINIDDEINKVMGMVGNGCNVEAMIYSESLKIYDMDDFHKFVEITGLLPELPSIRLNIPDNFGQGFDTKKALEFLKRRKG